MALESYLETIKDMRLQGSTYEDISSTLVSMGLEKGGSIHNIKKFCLRYNLKQKEVVSNTQLEAAVVQAVQEVS